MLQMGHNLMIEILAMKSYSMTKKKHVMPNSKIHPKDSLLTAKVASVDYVSNPCLILLVGSINGALNALIARMR